MSRVYMGQAESNAFIQQSTNFVTDLVVNPEKAFSSIVEGITNIPNTVNQLSSVSGALNQPAPAPAPPPPPPPTASVVSKPPPTTAVVSQPANNVKCVCLYN